MASFNGNLRHLRSDAPRNSKNLALLAEDFQFTDRVPLKFWTRTAEALFKEVRLALGA